MSKTKKKKNVQALGARPGDAVPHGKLKNDFVHVFVDDQNLFLGIVNQQRGASYRIDFGLLLNETCKDATGKKRPIKSAYIAGVIPNDDSFWEIAKSQGFVVNRGFLGAGGRSKQDDAFLITDIMETLQEQEGPSTIVLVAGDADYVPPLTKTLKKGWRNEVAYITSGLSTALAPVIHEFRTISASAIELD